MSGRVAWLTVAPVKALALAEVEEIQLEHYGARGNRRFHLVDPHGLLVNGKRHGPLARVRPEVDDAAGTLALRFPDGTVVAGTIAYGPRVETTLFGKAVPSRELAGPWAAALSDYAGQELRLVEADETGAPNDRGPTGGASLLSRASLDALARQLGVRALDPRRFRMLIGIDGVGEHEEEGWLGRPVRVGDAVVVPRGNVGRCAVTTQDPETGVRDLDTLGALEASRGGIETTEPLPLGIWGEVVQPGRVRLGDQVVPG